MPIPRKLFDEGLDEVDQKICRFLEQNQDMAYTLEEIVNGIGMTFSPDISGALESINLSFRLNGLITKGYITSRVTGSGTYYAWRKPK